MENKNQNSKQENGVDISPDALKGSGGTQTVVKPKVNLSPNSEHEYSDLETIPEKEVPNASTAETPGSSVNPENNQSNQENKDNLNESNNVDQEQNESENKSQKDQAPEQNQQTVTPPTQNKGGDSKPPRKIKKGMSDNMKYILIGLLVTALVAGGIVAWNILSNREEQPTTEDPVVQEPIDQDETETPVDETAPELTITNPKDGEPVSETFTIEGTITDESEIESLSLYMNDSIAEEITSPSESFTIDVDSLNFANGTYTLYLVAVDSEGNEGQSEEVTIEITNTEPEPTEEEPDESEEPADSEDEEPQSLPRTGAGWH